MATAQTLELGGFKVFEFSSAEQAQSSLHAKFTGVVVTDRQDTSFGWTRQRLFPHDEANETRDGDNEEIPSRARVRKNIAVRYSSVQPISPY